jgi:hypothetical protein
MEVTVRLLSGEAWTLSNVTPHTRLWKVKSMVCAWALGNSTCADSRDFDIDLVYNGESRDFDIDLVYNGEVLSAYNTLGGVGITCGSEIQGILQFDPVPALVDSSDDEIPGQFR